MTMKTGASVLALSMAAIAFGGEARAETSAPASSGNPTVEEVVVTGEQVRSLEQFTPTGSRLNLSAKETPATLDVINNATITTRGFLFVEEAANSMPGVTSGGAPGDLENFHIRGFSDTQITVLHNGIYVAPSPTPSIPRPELGGGVRYVGERTGDTAGSLKLNAYTTLNAYLTYNVKPGVAVSFRVDNLTDKAFAQAADVFYPSEVILGRPRYYQVDISARF